MLLFRATSLAIILHAIIFVCEPLQRSPLHYIIDIACGVCSRTRRSVRAEISVDTSQETQWEAIAWLQALVFSQKQAFEVVHSIQK